MQTVENSQNPELQSAIDQLVSSLSPLDGASLIQNLNHSFRRLSLLVVKEDSICDMDHKGLDALAMTIANLEEIYSLGKEVAL